MKKRQHILPCGRVHFFKEMGPRDLAMKPKIKNAMLAEAEALDKFSAYEHSGRKRKVWCKNTYNKFVTLMTSKLVDHLMASDRIKTAEGRYWVIADVGESPKHVNWHSNGAVYSTRIQGIPGDYRILLSNKRGKELKERVLKGQTFHKV